MTLEGTASFQETDRNIHEVYRQELVKHHGSTEVLARTQARLARFTPEEFERLHDGFDRIEAQSKAWARQELS